MAWRGLEGLAQEETQRQNRAQTSAARRASASRGCCTWLPCVSRGPPCCRTCERRRSARALPRRRTLGASYNRVPRNGGSGEEPRQDRAVSERVRVSCLTVFNLGKINTTDRQYLVQLWIHSSSTIFAWMSAPEHSDGSMLVESGIERAAYYRERNDKKYDAAERSCRLVSSRAQESRSPLGIQDRSSR